MSLVTVTCVWLQDRCVNIIANLYNAPLSENEQAVGTGCVGSSEAIMLAGLAFKRRWQAQRKAAGKPYDKPNIVFGSEVQVSKIQEVTVALSSLN